LRIGCGPFAAGPQDLRGHLGAAGAIARGGSSGTPDADCCGQGGAAMKCADIMNTNLEWLTEKDTISKAAAVMAEANVGFLPICDANQRVVGVVTDRDLTTRALAKRIAPDTTSATLVMSSPAITCLETADVGEAENLMSEERKSRLVITDAEGRLTGVLSVADLIEQIPGRKSLQTLRAVLWREALGPRAGAPKGQKLLKDDPIAQLQPRPSDDLKVRESVVVGGHHTIGTKEFPV
jgi:CBS domain-containing protein